MESNNCALQTELNNLKNTQNSSALSLTDVQADLAAKTDDLEKLRSRNVGLETEKLTLESTISELRGTLESANENLASLMQSNTADQATISEQSKSLQESLAALQTERSELLAKLDEQEIERSRLSEDTKTLQDLLAKVTSERDLALNDLSTAQGEIGLKIEEEVLRHTASQQDLLIVEQEQVKSLNSSLIQAESQVQDFKSKVSGLEKLRDQLESVSGKFFVLSLSPLKPLLVAGLFVLFLPISYSNSTLNIAMLYSTRRLSEREPSICTGGDLFTNNHRHYFMSAVQ